jgi:hypothetical protein
MLSLIDQNRGEFAALCRRFRVRRLELFGSAADGRFDPERSDFDFLIEFEDLGYRGAADRFFGMKESLEQLLGRPVDLLEIQAVSNPYLLREIERSRTVLYAA